MDLLIDDLCGVVLLLIVVVYCCNVGSGNYIDLGLDGCDVISGFYGGSVFCVQNLWQGVYCGSNDVVVMFWIVQIEKCNIDVYSVLIWCLNDCQELFVDVVIGIVCIYNNICVLIWMFLCNYFYNQNSG